MKTSLIILKQKNSTSTNGNEALHRSQMTHNATDHRRQILSILDKSPMCKFINCSDETNKRHRCCMMKTQDSITVNLENNTTTHEERRELKTPIEEKLQREENQDFVNNVTGDKKIKDDLSRYLSSLRQSGSLTYPGRVTVTITRVIKSVSWQ